MTDPTSPVGAPFTNFVPLYGGSATVAQALRPFPQYMNIDSDCCLENFGSSTYNALLPRSSGASAMALTCCGGRGFRPEIIEQAWYQLGVVYRRLHRMQEAQQALAAFQNLKDAEAKRHLQRVEKKRSEQASEGPPPPGSPKNP